MKKNNEKGFMLVEAFIVSTIVLGVLVFMFVQIRTVVNGFDKSFSYNTVPGIYIANELSKFIEQNGYDSTLLESNGYIMNGYDAYKNEDVSTNEIWNEILTHGNVKNVIVTDYSMSKLKSSDALSTGLEDYIYSLQVDTKYKDNRIIVEFNDKTYASLKLN
ncbi:MAG: hypothetical protein E7173_01905 [Firmicutes bacterium]|nr:hypothetical protein [Bacillota bacterium]